MTSAATQIQSSASILIREILLATKRPPTAAKQRTSNIDVTAIKACDWSFVKAWDIATGGRPPDPAPASPPGTPVGTPVNPAGIPVTPDGIENPAGGPATPVGMEKPAGGPVTPDGGVNPGGGPVRPEGR